MAEKVTFEQDMKNLEEIVKRLEQGDIPFKEEQYDKLAETMREYLDMDAVYGMLREAKL